MKPSHLSTPRTLSECRFDVGYPLADPHRGHDPADHIVFWGCFVAATVAVLVMVFVPGAW